VEVINQLILLNSNKIDVIYKGSKGPLIVILPGMGCSYEEWHQVIESISKTRRVMSFHRQGLGGSELGEGIQHTESAVIDLAGLIAHFQIQEPFYLVGHSYGGLCVQHFAKRYPQLVAGMILVDSTSVELKELENLDLPVMNEESDASWIEMCLEYASKSKEELTEIIHPTLHDRHRQFPETIQQNLLDFQVNPSLYKAMASEIKEWTKDAEVIAGLGDFPDIPLIVIGRDKEYTIASESSSGIPDWELRRFEEKWQELIVNQSKLTSSAKFIIAEGAGHSIFLDRPDLVIEYIEKISGKKGENQ
jgi:pimeloyl-ACP methyl ester carboxylesterase